MFCNHCGNTIPEGTAFCNNCGAPAQQQAAPQQAYYQQPQAPAPVKKNATPITITFIISVVLIIASILAPMVMNFFEVPIVSVILEAADGDMEETVDDMKDELDGIKDDYEDVKDELSSKEKKNYKKMVDSADKMLDNFSLLNMSSFMKTMDNLDEEYRPDDMEEAMETFSQAMGVVFGVVCGAFVLPLLFAILGGLKKSAGLTIAALIFTAISQAILSGVLLLILSAVVYIVQIVLCNKYKKA